TTAAISASTIASSQDKVNQTNGSGGSSPLMRIPSTRSASCSTGRSNSGTRVIPGKEVTKVCQAVLKIGSSAGSASPASAPGAYGNARPPISWTSTTAAISVPSRAAGRRVFREDIETQVRDRRSGDRGGAALHPQDRPARGVPGQHRPSPKQ